MRVFVTGASGFVGSAIVDDLIKAGHQVLGLARSESSVEKVKAAGADVHHGDIYDLESIKQGAMQCDAVIHTAFNHDFSKFKDNCETDRKVIATLGEALRGTEKPLVVTSGVGLLRSDHIVTEDELPQSSEVMPRAASEEAARAAAAQGVDAYIVRLPPTTHDKGDHGFIPMVINMDKEKGMAAYVGDGSNRWPAVHRSDAATLYRLIIEKRPELKVFHPVAEEGIPFREIAEAIGKGLQLPVESKSGEEAAAHFGWFLHYASFNCPSSSEKTRAALNWEPKGPSLMADLEAGHYFKK
ncbi:SDR family oxidoreductase [Mucilaginibacter sp. KACC 22063]|uniref:SDR family oxidoreductase n=1 Tax=Mucilaginibacter sp. KACC 22063 TaxID=3025666 RepID=UPI002365CA93|nr:SDR family oxidoreductase [Mucilaginibacter sp. KACC 22063]WDF55734.1 SDR family oxidoreductase [Mucilaginibacter sp. KACC 22063]